MFFNQKGEPFKLGWELLKISDILLVANIEVIFKW